MAAFKAQAHARELKQRLALSYKGTTIAETQDADGFPTLTLTNGAATSVIKIYMDGNAGRVNGLNLPQQVFSPHICEVNLDDGTTTAEIEMNSRVIAAVAKLGMKVIIKNAAGTVTHATLGSDEINPLIQSQ